MLAAGGKLMEEAFTVICQQFFSYNCKIDKRTEFPFDVMYEFNTSVEFMLSFFSNLRLQQVEQFASNIEKNIS